MSGLLRQVWQAVRPITAQQRFLWWCGTLLIASGAVHAVVAAVDRSPWWGAVSWRKPVVFALSFGILAWSVVWVLRHLPIRGWGWIPVGMLGGTSTLEVGLITMQQWRGQPSHFNVSSTFNAAVWSVMGSAIILTVVAVAVLLFWSLARADGGPAVRIAVVAGLVAILASGYLGSRMAAAGQAVVDATGHVPASVVFGAAGSIKLAHALGMYGLQVLGLLAIGLGLRPASARTQIWLMGSAAAGYWSVFVAATVTAYAGRAWTSPTLPMGVLAVVGIATLVAVAAVVIARLVPVVGFRRAAMVR